MPLSPEDRATLDEVMREFPALDAAGAAPLCKTLIRFGMWVYMRNPFTAMGQVAGPTSDQMRAAIKAAKAKLSESPVEETARLVDPTPGATTLKEMADTEADPKTIPVQERADTGTPKPAAAPKVSRRKGAKAPAEPLMKEGSPAQLRENRRKAGSDERGTKPRD